MGITLCPLREKGQRPSLMGRGSYKTSSEILNSASVMSASKNTCSFFIVFFLSDILFSLRIISQCGIPGRGNLRKRKRFRGFLSIAKHLWIMPRGALVCVSAEP